jgi:hypothetical protein
MRYFWRVVMMVTGCCAAVPAIAGVQTAAPRDCEVHYWPARNMGAAVDRLVGPGLIDDLLGAGKHLPATTEKLRESLTPEAQFALLKQVDFTGLLGSAPPAFHLETGDVQPFALKKKSLALLSPRADCYVEIMAGGISLNVHKIYGVTVSSAVVVRVYGRDPMPKVAVLTGGGTKIAKGMSKVSHSADDLATEMQRSFLNDLRDVVGYVAKVAAKSH